MKDRGAHIDQNSTNGCCRKLVGFLPSDLQYCLVITASLLELSIQRILFHIFHF